MLFNSLSYALFLPIVFLLYWFVFNKNYKYQNVLLLINSYFFYACWDSNVIRNYICNKYWLFCDLKILIFIILTNIY